MISVHGVSKRYGRLQALRSLSFVIGKGELVAFVGPNGAGKTTTLRILTGYLRPDAGAVKIAGTDVQEDRPGACEALGYMPEGTPMPLDMRVVEFLHYRAELKGVVRKRRNERVASVVEQLDLGEVQRRLIGRLSRGFRQRVALADALVADPPVLILDEPMTGLDPLQRRGFREFLRELAVERTLLMSTHVLPEVETLASRFLVLSAGRLLADGDAKALVIQAGLEEGASLEEAFAALVAPEATP